MDVEATFEANVQIAEGGNPGKRALRNPAHCIQLYLLQAELYTGLSLLVGEYIVKNGGRRTTAAFSFPSSTRPNTNPEDGQ
jgi:hypothetical protein